MEIQLLTLTTNQLPDAFILNDRRIGDQDGSLVLPFSPLARQALERQGVTFTEPFVFAVFVPMADICHMVAFLESEGLELSEL